ARNALPRLMAMQKAVPVAVVDPSDERLKFAQEYLQLTPQHCFTDPMEALENRRADFVIIASSTPQHEKLIEAAITHDMHILCESPVADTIQATLKIYRRSKNAKKKMAVASSYRLDQDKQTLEHFLREPDFGKLNYLVMRFTQNLRQHASWGAYRHQMNDPLILEAAIHHFDIIRGLTDAKEANWIQAHTWSSPWAQYRGDTAALITMEMSNGAKCLYEGSLVNFASLNDLGEEYIRAECSGATLELDRRSLKMISGGAHDAPTVQTLPLLEQEAWAQAWVGELFCDWLRGGQEPPGTISDYVYTAAMAFAAIESATRQMPIDVQQFLKQHVTATRP
ncbi:MAG TPA: Gfo/Idh/MocA family oxidoreductase, partial [Tepidisphaeraceae bacterium]|nr:Gfo/Idh/MocA family oxidoreductase [Tepidisphaeraceae bacterium]